MHSIYATCEINSVDMVSETRMVPLRIGSRHTWNVLPESVWIFLMKEVGREDFLPSPLTALITTKDDVSELNFLSDQSLNLSHQVPLVSVSYSH